MTTSAFQYHLRTSYDRDKMTAHGLDWQNQPAPFKEYPKISPVSLPPDFTPPEKELFSLLKEWKREAAAREIDIKDLSLILRLTYTITAVARRPGGEYYFRSAASAGALYPTEIYVAAHLVRGLDEGLYHFAMHRHCLYPLRREDLSKAVSRITQIPDSGAPTLAFFLTAIFFRSAWKYRERSYRYHLLDTGHLAENLIMALKCLGLSFIPSYDFEDEKLNHLLGLDETRECALLAVHVFGRDIVPGAEGGEIGELTGEMKDASRVAPHEIDYPLIGEIHRAGRSIVSKKCSGMAISHELGLSPKTWTKLLPPSPWPRMMTYPQAVFSRRSRRNFVKKPMGRERAASLIDCLCTRDFGSSRTQPDYDGSVSVGFLAGHAQDLEPGFYLLDRVRQSIALINPGLSMERMAHICLDQMWLTNAAFHFLFLTNIQVLEHTWGTRAYRYAMMGAGRMGQRLYIAATAMGLGCCGIGAFYDLEAAELVGLGKGSRLLYLVAVGPVKSRMGAPQKLDGS